MLRGLAGLLSRKFSARRRRRGVRYAFPASFIRVDGRDIPVREVLGMDGNGNILVKRLDGRIEVVRNLNAQVSRANRASGQ